jgi:hypothetical protein
MELIAWAVAFGVQRLVHQHPARQTRRAVLRSSAKRGDWDISWHPDSAGVYKQRWDSQKEHVRQ